MGSYLGICKKKDTDDFTESFFSKTDVILNGTNLDANEKTLFKRRYMNKLYSLRNYKHLYSLWFYFHRFLSTTLGVAIPALLSVQYYYTTSNENPIYWTAWGLSILSGFATGYNNVFKVDQRYYLLRSIYQKLKNEGWSYILLCKQYDLKNNSEKLKHKELFIIFMQTIEDIINDYHKNDMETVMQSDNKDEKEVILMQERALKQINGPDSASTEAPREQAKDQDKLRSLPTDVQLQILQQLQQGNYDKNVQI